MVASVICPDWVVPAELDSEGWYDVTAGRLYFVRDTAGRENYVMWSADGTTKTIDQLRAKIWAGLKEIGASDEDAERLSK